MSTPKESAASMSVLVTGGAGFIGCNLVDSLMRQGGHRVRVFDNLSRRGAERNLEWLRSRHPALEVLQGDVRDAAAVRVAAAEADLIYHLAAQVAVTTSVEDPTTDFEVNAKGTLNVLEAARRGDRRPTVVFTSTNKVYGGMEDLAVVERDGRYGYRDHPEGVSEAYPLDFHSPYGCSKGAADQYVRDYQRIYGLPTVVFRMSCIYGPRQFGNEDQGWVAHFIISAVSGRPLTIYGDGKQVRDVLFVEDLVRALRLVAQNAEGCAGCVYNIGGGPGNQLSLLQLVDFLEGRLRKKLDIGYGEWRPDDQRVYVSDPRRACQDFGWKPEIGVWEGLERLVAWAEANAELF